MKTTLILHGHFYQPPREAPDTGIIPKQESAYPSRDWNERITKECYAANAYSRYLTHDGRVASISNNYEYLSFNFGPTLLHWLAEHDRSTYERIIAADEASVRRLGHGNAIAQSFNHTILPLDSPQDAKRQIVWGLEDFSFHFGRQAEGIWLPETAVNMTVADLLIEQGISFIILSPWQAEAVESKPGHWQQLDGQPAPYTQPYILEGKKGSLAVFFYNPALAQGISFEHYLRDADELYRHLQGIQQKEHPTLLHSATDGEIFGHHEPFGDMCLAALVKKIETKDEFELSNYGTYLEAHPPQLRAKLRKGEGSHGSSWSCFHGVSRWYKDCGCSTGGQEGWNQKWRRPLRKTFKDLSTRLISLYEQHIAQLPVQQSPDELLLDYRSVVSGRETPEDFAARMLPEASKEERSTLLALLEGQRYRMYMFTSCGWFFAELSGLEPVQNMRYALQAVFLYQDFTDEDLLAVLAGGLQKAKSNISGIGTGKDILITVLPPLKRGLEAVSFFVLNRLFAQEESYQQRYGLYELEQLRTEEKTEFDLTITDTPLARRKACHVSYVTDHEEGIILHVYDQESKKTPGDIVQTWDLPERMIDHMYRWIDDSLSRVADNDLERISRDIGNYALLHKHGTSRPHDEFYITNMGTCLRTLHSLFRQDIPYVDQDKLPLAEQLLHFIQYKADEGIRQSTCDLFSAYMNHNAYALCLRLDEQRVSYIRNMLYLARKTGFSPDITALQNCIYSYITQVREGELEAFQELLSLASDAGLAVDDFSAQ
ncbi:MAG: DUF3536 domain-containing protein [Spirochaetota bacterium]